MAPDGPSATAQRVAAHRLRCARLPTSSGRPDLDDALGRDVAGATTIEPGRMHAYLAARTAFFDQVVVDALDDGLTQVVVLGAGYDARSLRYARAGVCFIEVDLAATQHDKLERLARLAVDASEVRYVAADFAAQDVAGRLVESGLDVSVPTLFVLEGVVPYLERDVLARLLAALRRVAADGSRFAVSVGVERSAGDLGATARASAFRARVAALGEPVRTSLGPAAGARLLARCGWEVRDDPAQVLDARPLGFLVAHASSLPTAASG